MVWVKADGFHPLLHLDQIHSRCTNNHKSTGQGPGETRLDLDSISYDQGENSLKMEMSPPDVVILTLSSDARTRRREGEA